MVSEFTPAKLANFIHNEINILKNPIHSAATEKEFEEINRRIYRYTRFHLNFFAQMHPGSVLAVISANKEILHRIYFPDHRQAGYSNDGIPNLERTTLAEGELDDAVQDMVDVILLHAHAFNSIDIGHHFDDRKPVTA